MSEPEQTWDEQIEDRVINLEVRITALGRNVVISLGASALAVGGVVLTQFVLGKMTKAFMQYGEIIAVHDRALRGDIADAQEVRPYRPDTGPDETREAPKDTVVAEPAMGPESLVSDEVRRQMETDPLQARDLLIDDGLGETVLPSVFDQDVKDWDNGNA